jgi:hypothetical protein
MKTENYFQKLRRLLASSQFAVFCLATLAADVANARAPLGLPDPSLLSICGSAAVIGVVAYRLKKRK